MKGDNGAPLDAAAFGASMLRVEEELGRVIDDVLAADVGDGGGDATAAQRGALQGELRSELRGAIEAAHALVPALPKAPGRDYARWLWGTEDSCALAHGYLQALALAQPGDEVVRFEITDRKTRRTVPVALPCASQAFVAADIRKRLRELRQLHKKNHLR